MPDFQWGRCGQAAVLTTRALGTLWAQNGNKGSPLSSPADVCLVTQDQNSAENLRRSQWRGPRLQPRLKPLPTPMTVT